MKRFLKDYRLHEYTEALFLLTLGIVIQVLDGSPLDVKHRWTLAWETEFPREYFSPFIQKIIKTVLSMIILVRCLTSVLYVLSGFVVAYCILRETSPKLMLPWLFISGTKSVLLTFLETLTGVYVCSSFGKIRKPCIEFVMSKAIELFFAIYLWACIRSIHKDMERVEEDDREEVLLAKMVIQSVNFRRRRARSMIDQTTLYKTANLNYFELKDVPNIIFDMLKTEEELSQDSLVCPGMMLASVSNMGSYDYLKTSLSLGELGFMDLNSFQVVGLDDDRHLCPYKRAMKFLKLTKDDIQKAKELTRRDSFIRNYEAPEEVPWSVIDQKHLTTHTRHQRQEEIFVAQLPDPDRIKDALKVKKRRKLPKGDILRDYSISSEEESRASEEKIIGLEEGGEVGGSDDVSLTRSGEIDGETTPDLWFMTNRKDEVNRIGLFETHTTKRADNYERLYKQNFMSDIGPEVFDKATKLVKLTSLSDINASSSGFAGKVQSPHPSTSRDPDVKPTGTDESDEIKDQTRRQKFKKKIAFEDHYGSHITMPLSITVTNFPLNKKFSNCEALYMSDPIPKRSGILFLPDSACEFSSEKYNMNGVCNEDSHRMEISANETDNHDEWLPPYCEYYRLNETKSYLQQRKFNLYILKYFKSIISDLKHSRVNSRSHKRVSQKGSGVRKVDNLNLPVLRSPNFGSPLEKNVKSKRGEFIYPEMYEQVVFTRDLMKRPIRDVLKSYYNLRELDIVYPKHLPREMYSINSIRRRKKKITKDSRSSRYEKYLMNPSNFGKKLRNASDHETEMYFIEESLRSYNSVERVSSACPKSEKMNSNRKNKLPPFYVFGNENIGWSNMPVNFREDCKSSSRSCKNGKYVSEPGLLDWAEQETSTVNKGDESSRGLIISSDSSMRYPKEDSLCSDEYKSSVDITPKPSETSSYRIESDEFCSKNTGSTSFQVMRKFICPDRRYYMYRTLNKERSDVEPKKNLPLMVNESFILSPSTNGKNVYSSPSPESWIMTTATNQNCLGSFDVSRGSDLKTLSVQPTSITQEVGRYVVNPDRTNKESLSRYKTGGKKKKKWLKFGNEEKSRYFGLKHTITNGAIDTSSAHFSTYTRRGIVHSPAAILQTNLLDKKHIQRVRQDG